MSFFSVFWPVVGAGAGLFACGVLYQAYRFLDDVRVGLVRGKK